MESVPVVIVVIVLVEGRLDHYGQEEVAVGATVVRGRAFRQNLVAAKRHHRELPLFAKRDFDGCRRIQIGAA